MADNKGGVMPLNQLNYIKSKIYCFHRLSGNFKLTKDE